MKALTNKELTYFCSQMALILKSGISSTEGLSLMLEDTPEGEGRDLLQTLLHDMEEGAMLYQALTSSSVFPAYMCSMTEIGENSGRLDEVMESLSEHFRREDNLSQSIRSSVTYPLVMLGMMIAIMVVLIVKVMPIFQQVFDQLGTEMTGISGAILELGNNLSRYSMVFLVVAAIAAIIFFLLFFTKKGRDRITAFSEHFFATRALSEKIACSRFASAMYLSLSSGLDIDQSLELAEHLTEHEAVRSRISRIRALTEEGVSLADAISESGMYSGMYARMLSVGFKTGSIDEVMKQISLQYDEEIENSMEGMVSKLEPTLVAILSVVVGMILLSVMLPLMGIMSNIG